jgi:hypothetical protein
MMIISLIVGLPLERAKIYRGILDPQAWVTPQAADLPLSRSLNLPVGSENPQTRREKRRRDTYLQPTRRGRRLRFRLAAREGYGRINAVEADQE